MLYHMFIEMVRTFKLETCTYTVAFAQFSVALSTGQYLNRSVYNKGCSYTMVMAMFMVETYTLSMYEGLSSLIILVLCF